MVLLLSLFLSFLQAGGFGATLSVEEADEELRYSVDFKVGLIRVAAEGEDFYVLVDTESRTVTLVRTDERIYCRFDPKDVRTTIKNGILDSNWFPWVYHVGPDLVNNLELRRVGDFRLPDGGRGRHWSAYSKTYDRIVADYWLDPSTPAELFFQWSKVYLDFWGEGEEEEDQAQRARLELYSRLEGFPVKIEERFRLLTRSRVLRVENRRPLPADVFEIPEDYRAKTPLELLWDDVLRRWFRPKGANPVPK
jgi:hypothetical protein